MRQFISFLFFASLVFNVGATPMSYNLPVGVTSVSEEVFGLHMAIFYICCAIGVVVFGLMFYSMIKHRKSQGAVPATFHENVKVEILWTIIPFLILVIMAIPASKTLIAMEDASEADLTIKVTGSQWKWHYEYFDHDLSFYSLLATPKEQIYGEQEKSEHYLLDVDKPLVLPANKKVRFLMTSDDVIHSWWVPDFAVKKDAIPGFINETWTKVGKPGTYRGQCTELCGKDHGFMPVVVNVLSEQDFDTWLTEQKTLAAQTQAQQAASLDQAMTMDELMALGQQVYMGRCAACHQPNGQGLEGIFPSLKGTELVMNDIQGHIDIVVHGKQGSAMQAFRDQLSFKELAAVITYERNAWGNNTGDKIQPADIANAISE